MPLARRDTTAIRQAQQESTETVPRLDVDAVQLLTDTARTQPSVERANANSSGPVPFRTSGSLDYEGEGRERSLHL